MDDHSSLVEIAAQLADRSRLAIVLQLMDGSSRAASELMLAANLSAPSTSMHLAKLVRSGILSVTQDGRNKYYRIAGPSMAHAVEALAVAANLPLPNQDQGDRGIIQRANPWAFARTCFDHLAGHLGVEVTGALRRHNYIRQDGVDRYTLTTSGREWFSEIGVDCGKLENERRALTIQCLDWSERRSHLGGALGAALLNSMLSMGWLAKSRMPRLIRLTLKGETELRKRLSLALGRGSKLTKDCGELTAPSPQ